MKGQHSFIVLCCALLAASTVRADVVNGGFETGTTGWSIAGQGTAHDASFGVTPTHDTWAGYIENTGNGTIPAATMESLLHLPTGTVTGYVSGAPTVGTVMWQNVSVTAGQTLTFDWNFMSDELNEDPIYDDFAFFSIFGATAGFQTAPMLASRNSSSFTPGGPVGFDGTTGWSTVTYNFTITDTYRIGFGVMNVTDGGHNSALMLDGISIPDLPEPSSLAVFALSAPLILRRHRI